MVSALQAVWQEKVSNLFAGAPVFRIPRGKERKQFVKLDQGYRTLGEQYLFAQVTERVRAFTAAHPERAVLRLGLGDVTRPLPPVVTSAMQMAVAELGASATFKGYSPQGGYPALRRAIQSYYVEMGVPVEVDDIFISSGAKESFAMLSQLFSAENTVLLPQPAHPLYEEISLLAGRPIVYVQGTPENGFLPPPPTDVQADLIYLSSPTNPTGAAYDRAGLTAWVEYANANEAVILYDAAYESFVLGGDIPRSIFEIPGANTCAIEVCSFSKTAGFTGLRCGYTVVPSSLRREGVSLRDLWENLATTESNGVAYPTQIGAAAAFSAEGLRQTRENLRYYQRNAARLAALFEGLGISFTGGTSAPYIWVRCPEGMDGWALFDALLQRANVAVTPGACFGRGGENYFRCSGFNSRENTARGIERMRPVLAELYGKKNSNLFFPLGKT